MTGVPQKPCPPADPAPQRPKFAMPPGACDSHAPYFRTGVEIRLVAGARLYATRRAAQAYEHLHEMLGVARRVITQPSVYGTDNSATLDYVSSRLDRARAVVSVTADVGDRKLETMHAKGARGIRVNIADPGGNPFASFADLHRVAQRLKPLGWHVELLLHVHEMDAHLADIRACRSISRSGISAICRRAGVVDHRNIGPFSTCSPTAAAG